MVPKRPREESCEDEEEEEEGDWKRISLGGESWQEVKATSIASSRGKEVQDDSHDEVQEEDEDDWETEAWKDSTPLPTTYTRSTPNEAIRVDPSILNGLDGDDDSLADGESLRASTASISSSILDYREFHGRQYQSSKTTEYWAPNDEKMTQCFDIVHTFTLMLMDDALHLAPIGTGSGIWAIDAADEYPSATVIGTDISAVQPGWVPPNCSFQIDDAQLPWTFKEDFFDFINIRYLYGGIDDWGKLYKQAFAHLRPGGWIENTEIDITTHSENPKVENDPDHLFKKWCQLFFEAGDKLGRTFKIARDGDMEKLMREAGFVDLVHRQWKVPIGGWPKDPKLKQIGLYNGAFIERGLSGFAVFPIGQVLEWTFDEVEDLVSKMRETLKDKKSLPYFTIHTVYGRRPKDISASDVESLD